MTYVVYGFSPVFGRIANPRAQVGLLPSPEGGFYVADAEAIKVSGYYVDFPSQVVTDRRPPTGLGIDE